MTDGYLLAAVLLTACVAIGLVRILLLPWRVEKLLILQLLGTFAVAISLLLAQSTGQDSLRDLGLVIGLLSAILAVAFVRLMRTGSASGPED